jgi:hypothetical protein
MSDSALIAHVDTGKITREELALLPSPAGTATHKVIPHVEVVNAIVEALGFRHVAVHRDEYAVSKDGNKMFGLMELDQTFAGCRFALGLRNSHDKSMRLPAVARRRGTEAESNCRRQWLLRRTRVAATSLAGAGILPDSSIRKAEAGAEPHRFSGRGHRGRRGQLGPLTRKGSKV